VSISVVIRAYNEAGHIGRLLHGLSAQTRRPDQVILVDSGSTDGTVDLAQASGVTDVVRIAKEEFSFGRALNLGIAAAEGELVVIPSAHIYPVYDTWIENLTTPLADDRWALAYGRQQGDHRTKFAEERLLERWFPATSNPDQDHPFCNNANAAIRRDVWARHPYDETLTGLEDLAWANACMQDGLRLAYVAEAPVVHVHEESWSQVVNRYRREAIAHKRIFPSQDLPLLEAAGLALRHVGTDLVAAARQRRTLRDASAIVAFRGAQFWGSYSGFRHSGPVTQSLKRHFYYPDVEAESVAAVDPEARPGTPIDYRD